MSPDRVDFTEMRVLDDSVARMISAKVQAGQSLEQIAAEDSVRMAQQSSFQVNFPPKSARTIATVSEDLTPVLAQLKADAGLRVQLTTHPDTSQRKVENKRLADERIKAVKEYFKARGIAEERFTTFSQPYNRRAMADTVKDRNLLNNRVNLDILGRRAIVVGKLETAILPVTTDERTLKADSLQVGEVSAPFRSKFGISIVRLNRKDPLRQKTFEEAGTEVSGAFQEFESKRLENEWLDGLRKRYPLVEYKETLKSAFAPLN
jgi:outer membrane protein OmpA-like peptidoglycan-associated protein